MMKNITIAAMTFLLNAPNLFAAEAETLPTGENLQNSLEVVNQLSEYGGLISRSLYFILFGMLVIYILHRLTSKYLYPHMKEKRVIKVLFGTLYALILVVSVLMVLKKLGFDVAVIGKISIISVLVGAVGIFFLLPFLPRLPFKIGHMVEIGGVLGVVDNISTYHTTVRKFDGTMVFIPNTTIMSSKIMNFHDIPERRIEMHLEISADSNISTVKELLLQTMRNESRVLDDPESSLFITHADASGIKVSAYCWVANGDWLGARSDLWEQAQNTFTNNTQVSMARPQQEVYLVNNNS